MQEKKAYKKVTPMKRALFLALLCITPLNLIGNTKTIELHNTCESVIIVNDCNVPSGKTIELDSADELCTIASNNLVYTIQFPDPSTIRDKTVSLDFSTIQWIAGNLNKVYPKGIDAITITNSTYYPIAVVYVLNAMRSRARTIEPQESASKQVGTEDAQKTGFLEITGNNHKKRTFRFPRRIYKRSSPLKDWYEANLCAQTIEWFDKGFAVSVR